MPITNVTELIWSDELTWLLRMCGEEESMIGSDASDYERFFALCRSAHLLCGNPLTHRISCFLAFVLGHPVSLSEENAGSLWRETADYLLFAKESLALWNDFEAEAPREVDMGICPTLMLSDFFEGDLLLHTAQKSWDAWQREMKACCDRFFSNGAIGVMLTLPFGFSFSSPHPYSVGLSLQRDERGEGAGALLLAQLFRFLAEECQDHKKALLCRVACEPAEAVKLFAYAEERVGLPRLIWSMEADLPTDPLLAFNRRYHPNSVEAALPKIRLGERELQVLARVYPLGKLQVLV